MGLRFGATREARGEGRVRAGSHLRYICLGRSFEFRAASLGVGTPTEEVPSSPAWAPNCRVLGARGSGVSGFQASRVRGLQGSRV